MKTEKVIVAAITVIAFIAITISIIWLSASLPGADYISESSPQLAGSDEYPTYPSADEESMEVNNDESLTDEEYFYSNENNGDENNDNYHAYNEYPYTPAEILPVFKRESLPEHIIEQITGVTFHESTPFEYSFLTYVTVTHVNFQGESVIGHLIVADEIGDEVLDIFREIYESGFPIYSIRLIDYFDASDYYSMAANNSHAFNFRYIAGTNVISRHGFGMAIDINPIQNPYIRGETIWPAAGVAYLDRTDIRPGMIVQGCPVYNSFISRGWIWGGHWTSPRDYHHFERRN